MVQPGVCYNGCCRFQTCMNGGTCVELCDTPKEKFYCKCPPPFTGKLCEKGALSCLDFLDAAPIGTTLPSGNYTIRFRSGVRTVFCDFIDANQAWILIESFSRENNMAYKTKAFHQNNARSQLSPNWEDYRPGLPFRKYMRNKTSMFRATCDFPKRGGVLTPDYLFGYLSDYDIINHGNTWECRKFGHVNVRGYNYFNVSLFTVHFENVFHLHFECPASCPGFTGVPNSVGSEDCFGFYVSYNPASKCTATAKSTTQWWFGEEL